jgi:hypothetical protein
MGESEGYEARLTPDLVRLYERAASEYGQATRRRDFVDGNRAVDEIAAIYCVIRSRGLEHQRLLLPLLFSSDSGVCAWAAAHALEFEPRQGEAILTELAKQKGMEGFSAKMALKTWREGRLRFP